MTPTAAAILAGYLALAGLIGLAARVMGGPAWAAVAICGGLAATATARVAVSTEVLFLAFALIWVTVGTFVAVRGQGVIAILLLSSGLCYLGAQLASASVPGWSVWFRAADTFGLAALLGVLAGGDDGIGRMVRRARLRLGAGDRSGAAGGLARVATLEEQAGKGR